MLGCNQTGASVQQQEMHMSGMYSLLTPCIQHLNVWGRPSTACVCMTGFAFQAVETYNKDELQLASTAPPANTP